MSTAASPDLIFGKYEIQSRLAVGGMGEVFFAVQRGVQGFERPAILKNLLPDLAQQETFVEQFLDEARVAATLNHPNVVSIYEVGLWNGTYFIAMEYIQGRNISQLIRASIKGRFKMSPLVAGLIVRDAALGLHHAHVAVDGRGEPLNIVHRDVSPQNIMVRDDGVTKVVDFGIARAANRATRTQTGAVKGKLAYMPPEQILAGGDITSQADQYALGVVLWEMCTGRRLFRAEREVELMRLVVAAQIPPLMEAAPETPEALAAVVSRMLEREPSARFPSCAIAARELDFALQPLAPAGNESPVAEYLRGLGPWDMPTPQITPSGAKQNFFISLSRAPTSDEANAVEVDLGATGQVPSPKPLPAAPPKPRRALFAGLCIVMALGLAAVAWQATRPAPVVVAPPVAPLLVKATPPPPVPKEGEPQQAPTAPATWVLKSVPDGATVRLDGRPLGQTPLELMVSAAEPHFLQFERPGFRREERELKALESGARESLQVTMVALKAAPVVKARPVETPAVASGPGFLTLSTTPWTKVSTGRDVLGSTPLFKVRLPAGEHTLQLVNEGQNINVTRRVTIKQGEVTKLDVKL